MISDIPFRLDPVYGCWLFTGPLDRDGYGRIGSQLAHRVAYEARHGAIPAGMEVEHTCRRRACIRHLELLTRSQQERAKSWRTRAKRAKCVAGHDMSLHSIVTPEGGRVCRMCK